MTCFAGHAKEACHMIKKSMGKTFDQGLQLALADGLHVRCTRHTSHVTRHTSHVTRHASRVTRHTSHFTRHTSHVTRHTSHVTRDTGTGPCSGCCKSERRQRRHFVGVRQDQVLMLLLPILTCCDRSAIRFDESFREDILGGEHSIVADTWKTISAVYRCWWWR
jgi:hypothetical protein